MRIHSLLLATTVRAFMSDIVPTVQIVGDDGPVLINASDYDAEKHELYTPKKSDPVIGEALTPTSFIAPVPESLAPSAPFANANPDGQPSAPATLTPEAAAIEAAAANPGLSGQRLVVKTGSKYFVVDTDGNKITGVDGIDENGYKSEADAWTAVTTAVQQPVQAGTVVDENGAPIGTVVGSDAQQQAAADAGTTQTDANGTVA